MREMGFRRVQIVVIGSVESVFTGFSLNSEMLLAASDRAVAEVAEV